MQRMSARNGLVFILGVTVLTLVLSACVVYEPYPYSYPQSQYDRVWDSAIKAAQEVGIDISAIERDKGIIAGRKGPVDATITVQTLADGKIKVHMTARGPEGAEPNLTDRFYQAYQRYMGR